METKSVNISEVQKGDVIILKVSGKLDSIVSPQLEKKACEYIAKGHQKLILDMSDISYVNSCGLRMLLSIKKQMKAIPGKFIVCNLRAEVIEIMKICGFDHVLAISKDEEEALRQF